MAKETNTLLLKIAYSTKCLLSTGVKYSVKAIILSSMIFIFCGGMNLATVNQAAAAQGNWWQTAQNGGLNQVGQAYGTSGTSEPRDIRAIIIDIVKVILGFLGILAMILILFAGFKWMTAGGNEEQVSDAKNILIAGVIGLVIILCAYIIANFVINQIYGVATGQPVLFY